MGHQEAYTIRLDNFEGPLEFLLHLVQKSELDIYDIRLRQVADQFIREMSEPDIDLGAEFIGTLASLIWLKSKMLLPKHEQESQSEEEEIDPHFEVIHQLIDYCRFKQAGKELVQLEHEQNAYFSRGVSGTMEVKQPLGIEHLSLEDLALLFQGIVDKAASQRGLVHEENFRVSDKIRMIRNLLGKNGKLPFETLFEGACCKEELIVIFLAVLELMKLGEACVMKNSGSQCVFVISRSLLEAVNE